MRATRPRSAPACSGAACWSATARRSGSLASSAWRRGRSRIARACSRRSRRCADDRRSLEHRRRGADGGGAVRRLVLATAFLTRLPVPWPPGAGAAEVARSLAAFPVVGAALGAVLAGAGVLLARALPLPLVGALVAALGAALTGALHLDGLADTADGLGGGRDA